MEQPVEKEKAAIIDFPSLKKINEQMVGWILIGKTVIDYPIVQGQDNDHYLNYTFEDKRTKQKVFF